MQRKCIANISDKRPSQANRSVPLNLDQATISPSRGPTYDQAYLNELKSSTPSVKPANVDPYDADMSMDVDSSDISTRSIDIFQGKF